MPELDISSNQVIAATAVLALITPLFSKVWTWIAAKKDRQSSQTFDILQNSLLSAQQLPKIHATNGVPTFEQLTRCTSIDPANLVSARAMYEHGLQQYNHPVNNRDGLIVEAQNQMRSLAARLTRAEIETATSVSIAMADGDDDELSETEQQYDAMSPDAKTYAELRRVEQSIRESILNDLRKDVRRTDFTEAKALVAAGDTPLDAVMSQFPLPWQDLRRVDQLQSERPVMSKPPKPKFVHAMFLTPKGTIAFDKHAEKDGKWVRSDKHKMMAPYPKPFRVMRRRGRHGDFVPTGEFMVVVGPSIPSEWLTEMWRRDGYFDEQYRRAREGRLPKQVRAYYRRQRILTVLRVIVAAEVVLFAVLVLMRFL